MFESRSYKQNWAKNKDIALQDKPENSNSEVLASNWNKWHPPMAFTEAVFKWQL